MVDNGYLENQFETRRCPPTLYAFDLNNDRRILKVPIPSDVINKDDGEYLFTNVIVETDGHVCQRTTVISLYVYKDFCFLMISIKN